MLINIAPRIEKAENINIEFYIFVLKNDENELP